ncbi:MAG: LEPR-XLL domain-containing protein, partial [Phycisphaera sp.]|nr:LEPR-XLL domain-containing protein [Phycisphaera sp.]
MRNPFSGRAPWDRRIIKRKKNRGQRRRADRDMAVLLESLEPRVLMSATTPVAVDDTGATDEDTVLTVVNGGSASLVTNDTDMEGDTLRVVSYDTLSTLGAAVSVNNDGTFSYDPTASSTLDALGDGVTAVDTFTYTIADLPITTDGLFSVQAFEIVGGGADTALDGGVEETIGIWKSIDAGASVPGTISANGTTYNLSYESDTETVIDYAGGGGDFGTNNAYATINGDGPGGSGGSINGDPSNMSIRATAYLQFNTGGTYSISTASDDGRFLLLTPVVTDGTFTGFTARGEQVTGGAPTYGLMYDAYTGHDQTTGVFTVAAGDILRLDGFMFEGGGGDSFEISIKAGSFTTFTGSGDGWALLADGVQNIDVSSTLPTTSTATVSITVTGTDGIADTGATDEQTVLTTVNGGDTSLLDNDSEPGPVVSFDSVSANGALVNVNPDGTFTYDPTGSPTLRALADGAMVVDTFDYAVSNGIPNNDGLFNVQAYELLGGGGDTGLDTTTEGFGIWNAIDAGATVPGLISANATTYNLDYTADTSSVIDYAGDGADFGVNLPYNSIGDGSVGGPNNISVRASGYLEFTTGGDYTISIASDDGRRLSLTPFSVSSPFLGFERIGEQFQDSGDPNVLFYDPGTGHDQTTGVFHVEAGDILRLDGFFVQGGGGNSFEISIKQGRDLTFGGTGDGWALLTDGVAGINVSSGIGQNVTTASITVNGLGAVDDNYATDENTILNVAAAGVLANDTDPDGLSVLLSDTVSAMGAAVTVNSDGSFSYDPTVSTTIQELDGESTPVDTFTYTVIPFGTPGVQVNVYSSSGPFSSSDAARAANLLSGSTIYDRADMLSSGSDGRFAVDYAVPGGLADNFSVFTTGYLVVVADGTYTFGTNTDDGSRLRIDLDQSGTFDGGAEDLIVDDTGHAATDRIAAPVFLTAGAYEFEWTWYEGNGGAEGEFFYAPGSKGAFDGAFRLIGDSSQGIYAFADEPVLDTATVSIDVTGLGTVDDTYGTDEDTVLNVPAAGVLTNDTDPDVIATTGDTTSAKGAVVSVNTDGSFSYDPTGVAAFQALRSVESDTDSFEYTAYYAATPGVVVEVYGTDGPLALSDAARAGGSPVASAVYDFADIHSSSGSGHFSVNNPVPGGLTTNFSVFTTGYLVVATAGTYTFGTTTDDGSRLRIDLDQSGTFDGGAENMIVDDADHGVEDRFATPTYFDAGLYAFEWTWFQGVGGATGELFYAPGSKGAFDATFRLVGDSSQGVYSFASLVSETATVNINVAGVNDPPVANDDAYTTDDNTPIVSGGMIAGLLDNDTDVDATDVLSVIGAAETSPTNTGAPIVFMTSVGATVTVNGDGSFIYDPTTSPTLQAMFYGDVAMDTFEYLMSDIDGATDVGAVTITINGANTPPYATDNTASVTEDTMLTDSGNVITDDDGAGVDTDIDGNDANLIVTEIDGVTDPGTDVVGMYGSLDWDTNGGYTYTLDNANTDVQNLGVGDTLTDTFTYTVSGANDGLFNVQAFQVIPGGGSNDDDLNDTNETLGIWNAIDASGGMTGAIAANGKTYNVGAYESDTEVSIDYAGGGGDFPTNRAYATINSDGPGGGGGSVASGGGDQVDFSVRAGTYLYFPVGGTYSIAAASDDGRRISLTPIITGGTFTGFTATGGQVTADADPYVVYYNDPTGHNNTVGVFSVDAGDVLYLDSFFFERGGGDSFEISIKAGSDTGFGGLGDGWALLADGVAGVQVSSTADFAPLNTSTANLVVTINGNNDDPTVAVTGSDPVTIDEGLTAMNTGTFADVDLTDIVTITSSVGGVTFDMGTNSGNWSWSYTPGDGPSDSQTVTITATDDSGGVGTATFDLVVNNVNPTITGSTATLSVLEGATVMNAGAFADQGFDDDVTVVVLDASDNPIGTVMQDSGDMGNWSWSYITQNGPDDTQTLRAFAIDQDGGYSFISFNLIVANVPPDLTIDGTPIIVNEGDTAMNTGTYTDPGPGDDVQITSSIGGVV